MRMSDAITAYIMNRIEECETDFIDLQRNSLAMEIGCAPSQINYVLSSRFTPERGFIVESRRGGGGYIRVQRIRFCDQRSMLVHVINSLDPVLSYTSAVAIIQNLCAENIIQSQTALAMAAAISEKAFASVPPGVRGSLRSVVFKHMLAAVLNER